MIRGLSCTVVEACVCVCVFNHTRSHWLSCPVFEKPLIFNHFIAVQCLRLTLSPGSPFSPSCVQYQNTMKTQHGKGFPKRNRTSVLDAPYFGGNENTTAGKVGESKTKMAKLLNDEQSRDGEVQFCPLWPSWLFKVHSKRLQ